MIGRSWRSVAPPAAALVAVLCAELALAIAYAGDAGWGADALTTGWIAALAAVSYVAWFSFGATFLRLGRGRWVCLGADALFGAGTSVVALPWPRAHVASLLGQDPLMDLPQSSSSALLVGIAAILLLSTSLRARG